MNAEPILADGDDGPPMVPADVAAFVVLLIDKIGERTNEVHAAMLRQVVADALSEFVTGE